MGLDVWDFGGQQIYHATHQFFLTDRSLFVLLWNSRLGWEQGRLRYWLDIIRARAPHSPVLLVATHAPAGGRPVDLPIGDLKREYPQLVGNLAIDNATGDGLPELEAAIRRRAASLPLMGVEWPKTWFDAAEAVFQLKENHVTPMRMWRTMAEAGLKDPRHQRYVASAMHSLGTVLYNADDPDLGDTVILRPEWVNEYISRVLDDPEVERSQGLLRRSRLDDLWGELDRGMRDHFLAMMDKYDLSYKTDVTVQREDVSLVVERLPWTAPAYRAAWDRTAPPDAPDTAAKPDAPEHEIRVVYRLNTMPPGIPTWFIARAHRFSTGIHWRSGALLAHPDGRHRALIRATRGRDEVELAVRGPAPASFFAVLDDGLNLTLGRYPGLSITCMVPCTCEPGCTGLYEYRDLQRRVSLDPPRLEIECRKSYAMVYVPKLLLGLPPSDRDEMRTALKQLGRQTAALDGRLAELAGDQQRMFLKLQQQIQNGLETKCPSVFLVTPNRESRKFGSSYLLRLYCEEPGQWHPLAGEDGVYKIAQAPQWLTRSAPYLRGLSLILKHAAPFVGPVLGMTVDHMSERAKAEVDGMEVLLDSLPEFDLAAEWGDDVTHERRLAERASTEADFRSLERMLTELDPGRRWGGLSRVNTPEGLTVYLCPEHAAPYSR